MPADKRSVRRLTENEAYFRQINETVTTGIRDLSELAARQNQRSLTPQITQDLHFYCECSDEDCLERLPLNITDYATIHKQRDHFIVKPGHQVNRVERVVDEQSVYFVVEKHQTPQRTPQTPHKTDVDNV